MLTEQYRPTYYRIRPQNSLGCRPLAPQTIIPWYLVGMPVGLTSLLGQVSGGGGAGQPHLKSLVKSFGFSHPFWCPIIADGLHL